jgi:DNA-binding transcriptional regulator LsrR (DeoR family)
MKKGNSNAAKLSLLSIEDIEKQYSSSKITMEELANQYNVTTTTIWRKLKNVDSDNKRRGAGKVSKYCNWTKINEDIATRILILYMSGQMTQKMIAEMYNLHQSTVSHICRGNTWKHLFQGVKEKYNKEILNVR